MSSGERWSLRLIRDSGAGARLTATLPTRTAGSARSIRTMTTLTDNEVHMLHVITRLLELIRRSGNAQVARLVAQTGRASSATVELVSRETS